MILYAESERRQLHDNQRAAVLEAISAAQRAAGQREVRPWPTLAQACATLGVPHPRVVGLVGTGFSVSHKTVALPESTSDMTTLHAVAHLATPSLFPAHGSEFCERLLVVTERLRPFAAEVLRSELDMRGVHHTASQRRRAVVKAVTQRSNDGTSVVEATADDPPERVVGPMTYDKEAGSILVGQTEIMLDRLRYLAKVA